MPKNNPKVIVLRSCIAGLPWTHADKKAEKIKTTPGVEETKVWWMGAQQLQPVREADKR